VRSWTHLERQRGGFGFLGGPGETQIEADRRMIRDRMAKIRRELDQVKRTRGLHRDRRQRAPWPVVALVGYTNAGKSTLFNRLTGEDVFSENLLFATLDPTMRDIKLPGFDKVILSDTVGFVSDLPTELSTTRLCVRSYRTTDAAEYFAACQRNRRHLVPYEQGNPALSVMSIEQAEDLMRRFAADFEARTAFFFGAFTRSEQRFAAQIYLGPVQWELPEFELGYFADIEQEGRGFVTEAAGAVLGFAFDVLGAQRVRLRTSDLNVRSRSVAERCGFVREGHLRRTKRHPPAADGGCSGELLYAILREEYLGTGAGADSREAP
jgi:RimJ/RimL family protein N-acetyltransferase